MPLQDAADIGLQHLNAVTRALLDPRNSAVDTYFCNPSAFLLTTGALLSDSTATLLKNVGKVRASYAAHGVTAVERSPRFATFLDPDTVLRGHVSRWRSDGGTESRQYATVSLLRPCGGDWKVIVSQFSDPIPVPAPPGARVSRPSGAASADKSILQTALDGLSAASLNRDGAALGKVMAPAFAIQDPHDCALVESKAEQRDRFDAISRFLDFNGVAQLDYVATTAQRITPDIILGTFRTYVIGARGNLVRSGRGTCVLIDQAGGWRILSIQNAIGLGRAPAPTAAR